MGNAGDRRVHAFWNRGPAGELAFPATRSSSSMRTGGTCSTPATITTMSRRVLPSRSRCRLGADDSRPARPLGLRPQDVNYVITRTTSRSLRGNKYLTAACTICHAKELEICGLSAALRASRLFGSDLRPRDCAQERQDAAARSGLDIYTPDLPDAGGGSGDREGALAARDPRHTAAITA